MCGWAVGFDTHPILYCTIYYDDVTAPGRGGVNNGPGSQGKFILFSDKPDLENVLTLVWDHYNDRMDLLDPNSDAGRF